MPETKKIIRIAMVDDHPLVRKALATAVDAFEGCRVVLQAGNGKELLDQLENGNLPDLIILDVNMPVMDGYTTAIHLRQHFPHIHILILTTYDSEVVTIRLLRAGARGVLVKHCEPDEFQEAIGSIMETGYYYAGNTASALASIVQNEDPKKPTAHLSDTELRFLELASTEMTYKEIALKMKMSPRTVDSYRDVLFVKLGVKSRVGLALYAVKNGLVKDL